jgi:hypothetical protein
MLMQRSMPGRICTLRLRLEKGRTAIDGFSGRVRVDLGASVWVAATAATAGVPLFLHRVHEAEALARQCLDQPLVLAAVADGASSICRAIFSI